MLQAEAVLQPATQNVFKFSLQVCLKILYILRSILLDTITNVRMSSRKISVFLVGSN